MSDEHSNTNSSDIIDSMNQAFNNGSFYGLEYILDEWAAKLPTPVKQQPVDWFGFWDFFA